MDLRGRCTAILEDPDAFRPATQFQAAQLGLQQPGMAAALQAGAAGRARVPRAVVPAALFAAQVVSEVMGWVKDVPSMGTSTLTGEAQEGPGM